MNYMVSHKIGFYLMIINDRFDIEFYIKLMVGLSYSDYTCPLEFYEIFEI